MSEIAEFLKARPTPTKGGDIAKFLGNQPRSALDEIGNQIAAGAMVELPEQAGKALQYTGIQGDTLYDLGTKAREIGRSNDVGYEPQPDQHNVVTNALAAGGRMLAPSVAAPLAVAGLGAGAAALSPVAIPGAVIGGAAALGAGAMFGAAQGQETYEKGIKAGVPEADAKAAGRANAAIEGLGETVGTLVGTKFVTGAGRAVGKALGRTAGQTALAGAADTSVIKPFLNAIPGLAATEVGTEIGQNAGEAAVEKAYGIDTVSPVDAGIAAIAPTLGMTALLLPFGLAGHGMRAKVNQNRMATLSNPEKPDELRAKLSDQIAVELGQVDPQAASAWKTNADQLISGKQPITLDDAMLIVRPRTPDVAQAQNEVTPTQAAVSLQPSQNETDLAPAGLESDVSVPPATVQPDAAQFIHPADAAAVDAAIQPNAGPLAKAAGIGALTGANAQSRAEQEAAAHIAATKQALKNPGQRIDQGPAEAISPQVIDFEADLAHQEAAQQAERQRQVDLDRLQNESRLPAQEFNAEVAAKMEPAEPAKTNMQLAIEAALARRAAIQPAENADERIGPEGSGQVPIPEQSVPVVDQTADGTPIDAVHAARAILDSSRGGIPPMRARIIQSAINAAQAIADGKADLTPKLANRLRVAADTVGKWNPAAAEAVRTLAAHVDLVRPKSALEQVRIERETARPVVMVPNSSSQAPHQAVAAVPESVIQAPPEVSRGGAVDLPALTASLQNRNRDSVASAAQMQKIARDPNPKLLMSSPSMSDGAPVVSDLGGKNLIPPAQIGHTDAVVTSKREIPIRYAVVEADTLAPSNFADGSRNPEYAADLDKITAINNGRTAALMQAYRDGTAGKYRAAIESAQAVHGISQATITPMRAPVLVRVMDASGVTANIGDESNASGTLALSAVEQARNDAARFDTGAVEYTDDGRPTDVAVRGFVAAMPEAEQQQLAPDGKPTKQAVDRMQAATFHAAYENPDLVELMAQSVDPEAKVVLGAMSRAAAAMAKLRGAGDLDIRPIVTAAAGKVINAVRAGVSLSRFLQVHDMLEGSAEHVVATMFAQHYRSARTMGDYLTKLAETARAEADRAGIDMFGAAVPLRSREQIINEVSDESQRQRDLEQQSGRQPDRRNDGRQANEPSGPDYTQQVEGEQQGYALETHDQKELARREAAKKAAEEKAAAEQAELARKEKAKEVESFDLTGSDRAADTSNQDSLFQPLPKFNPDQSDFFDPNQQSLFGDPYEKVETRPDTTEEQRDAGREAFAAAERRIFGTANSGLRGAPTLLGSRISKDFRAQGGITLVGQRVAGPRDLATIAQVLRDPRFETFRVFYVDTNDKIIGEAVYSSRLPGSVNLPFDIEDRIRADKVRFDAGKSGRGVRYWMLHNHPRGLAEASDADRRLTEHIKDSVAGFAGHVIIDHNEYHQLLPNGIDETVKAPTLQSAALADANAEVPHPLLGRPIVKAGQLVQIAKDLELKDGFVTIFATGGPLGTVGLITEIPVSVLQAKSKMESLRLVAAVRRATLQTGSGGFLFAVTPTDASSAAYAVLRQSGIFTDIVSADSGTSMAESGRMRSGRIPQSRLDLKGGKTTLPAWYAKESEPGYTPDKPDRAGNSAEQGKARVGLIDQANAHLQDYIRTQKTVGLWGATVGTMRGIAYTKDATGSWKHPDFRRVYDRVQHYLESTSRFAMRASDLAQTILPRTDNLTAAYRNVMQAGKRTRDMVKVQGVIWQGTLSDKREYGSEELKGKGFSPEQIAMYREARSGINQSLQDLASTEMFRIALTANVHQEMDPHSGIAALHDYYIKAGQEQIDELRNSMGPIADDEQKVKRTMTAITGLQDALIAIRNLKKRAEELISEGYAPLMRFGRYVVDVYRVDENGDPVRRGGEVERLSFQMFDSERKANTTARLLAAHYKNDSTVKVRQSIVNPDAYKQFQGMTPETVLLFAQQTGLDKIEAYREYLALAVSQRSALQRMYQERKGIEGFSEDLPRVLAAFITSNARRASTNIHLGELTRAVNRVRNGEEQRMAQELADYVRNPMEEASKLRGFLFFNFISGSIASAVTNVTGGALMLAPYLHQYTQGTGINLSTVLAKAAKMAVNGTTDPEMRRAALLAAQAGLTQPMEVHQLHADAAGSALGTNPYVRSGLHVLAAPFSAAETFNRRLSFYAAWQIAKAKGIADPMEFAAQTIAATQGVYNKGNRPVWARGALGATVFTFRQFALAYGEFLMRLPIKQRAIAVATLVVASGLRGIPFWEDAEDGIDTLMQALGYNFATRKKLHEWAGNILGEAAGQFLLNGMSTLPGMPFDVQQRLGFGNMIPGTSILKRSEVDKARDAVEAVGPVGGVVKNVSTALGEVFAGNYGKALAAVSPTAVQNAIKAVDMGTTGFYTDQRGRRVAAVSFGDAVAKGIGFQPQSVGEESRKVREQYQTIAMHKAVEADIAEKWAEGIVNKDSDRVKSAMSDLQKWNRDNPESRIQITPTQMQSRVRQMLMLREQRFIKSAPPEIRGSVATQFRQ